MPPFKLHYVEADGHDKEIEIRLWKGSMTLYHFKYRSDKLRVLLYYIMCATTEMIDVKKKVYEVLVKTNDAILEEFLKNNPKFIRIGIKVE